MSKKTYAIVSRCSNPTCNFTLGEKYPGMLKREVQELLEDGVTIECLECGKENDIDTGNGKVIPFE
jgi:hypothetical protein